MRILYTLKLIVSPLELLENKYNLHNYEKPYRNGYIEMLESVFMIGKFLLYTYEGQEHRNRTIARQPLK